MTAARIAIILCVLTVIRAVMYSADGLVIPAFIMIIFMLPCLAILLEVDGNSIRMFKQRARTWKTLLLLWIIRL